MDLGSAFAPVHPTVCCKSMKQICANECGKITCEGVCKGEFPCGTSGPVTCGPYKCQDIAAGSCIP